MAARSQWQVGNYSQLAH